MTVIMYTETVIKSWASQKLGGGFGKKGGDMWGRISMVTNTHMNHEKISNVDFLITF